MRPRVAGKNISAVSNYLPGNFNVHPRFFVEEQKLVYSANHYGRQDLNDPGYIKQQLYRDLASSPEIHPGFRELVVVFPAEGHGINEANKLAQVLIDELDLVTLGFVFTAVITGGFKYFYRCVPEIMMDHCDWLSKFNLAGIDVKNTQLDRKFLCLNRRPSLVRERLVHQLECRVSPLNLRSSLGSLSEVYQGSGRWINQPRIIDGVVDHEQQHNISDPRLRSCLFNVIAESSDQSDDSTWETLFVTEKTWKAMALHQIPIWMAVPGTVSYVRSLGFDVFDDICQDHDYDSIDQETQRQDRMIDIIADIDRRYDLDRLDKLRQDLWTRLQHNADLLATLSERSGRKWSTSIRNIW